MHVSGISTPALILDVNILKANAEKMRQLLEGTRLQLRPHYKSHKCAALAAWQVRCGAIGMTCAKLSEAEDLCDAGIEDILLANQVTDPVKIRRLADLAGKKYQAKRNHINRFVEKFPDWYTEVITRDNMDV